VGALTRRPRTRRRPTLERLLEDIERGRVDVVVVYKVDRLSRSLGDSAGMMQLFDARGVSLVSVTQQFDTTTSIGRLTLNMLLSFAQFESEVAESHNREGARAKIHMMERALSIDDSAIQ
jgi:DNA invertase Pin-like site-specific DNA recombinase